jgi:hypothetical protein
MRFGINLRGDLAKLDDAEIAAMHEALMTGMETTYLEARYLEAQVSRRNTPMQFFMGIPIGRGLFHARIFYKVLALMCGNFPYIDDSFDRYLLDCELKDVRDEIGRRVRHRQKAIAAT